MNIKYIFAKLLKKARGTAIIGSKIHKSSKLESGTQFINSTMQKHSFCGYDCDINYADIGSFCSIANSVVIGGGMHPIEWLSTSPVFYCGKDSVKAKFSTHDRKPNMGVKIGHDVWIGQNTLIKQGVKIGTGAVVGMGSVVTKDVAPYSIVAGNPASVIRMRFNDDLINRLIESSWWTINENILKDLGRYSNEPEVFLEKLNSYISGD